MQSEVGEATESRTRGKGRWVVGGLVGVLGVAGLVWGLNLGGADPSGSDASEGESTTSSPSDESTNGEGSADTAAEDGSLQQRSDDPGPQVSTVPIGPGKDPAATEDLSSLTADDVEVSDGLTEGELKDLDEQVQAAESSEDSADAVAEMDSALEDYSSEQDDLLIDPEGLEVEEVEPAIIDDLESEADQMNDEIAQSIKDGTQP